MPSLLDWSTDPAATDSPLPSLSTPRRSGSWPVGLLPIPALAADLARRGLRYRPRLGFSILGSRVDGYEVARMASVALTIAGEQIAPAKPRSAALLDEVDALDAEDLALQVAAHDESDDYEDAEALYLATSTPTRAMAAALGAALTAPDVLALDREEAALGDTFREHAEALLATARDVKASPAAQRILLAALRQYVPAPDAATSDEGAALAFLATFDALPTLPRADLGARYAEADCPGALPTPDLYALASARWGAPRKLRGIYTYRPASAATATA